MKSPSPSLAWTLTSLSLPMLLSSLGTSIANVALPTLAREFDVAFQQVQWVVLAYLLAITTLIVSVGRLGDLIGRRRLLLAGILLFSAASLCGGLFGFWPLIAARALQGLGAATMMALSMAFVADTVPKDKTGRAMGLLGTMSAIGTALGPSLGGLLIAAFGWRAIFLVNVPLGLLAFLLTLRHLPGAGGMAKTQRAGFDYPGTLLLALTLAAYALAMTLGRGHFGPLNTALLLVALIGLGVFVLVETKVASPLVRLTMLRDPALSAGLTMSGLVATVMMATLVIGPFYLARGLALDTAYVGLAMSVGPVLSALSGVPAGHVVDRFGAQNMTLAGLCAMVAGTSLLCLLPASLGVAGYVGAIIVLTPGYALFQAANNTAVMSGIGPEQRGVMSGLVNLARNLGLVTGASVLGAIFAYAAGVVNLASASPAAVAAGMHFTFGVATLLVAGAIAIGVASRVLAARPALSRDAP